MTAALTIRFQEYRETVTNLPNLRLALWSIGKIWTRPTPRQPALAEQAAALRFLTGAIEHFSEEPFPSSRVTKKPAIVVSNLSNCWRDGSILGPIRQVFARRFGMSMKTVSAKEPHQAADRHLGDLGKHKPAAFLSKTTNGPRDKAR